jgi:hypothetical protein
VIHDQAEVAAMLVGAGADVRVRSDVSHSFHSDYSWEHEHARDSLTIVVMWLLCAGHNQEPHTPDVCIGQLQSVEATFRGESPSQRRDYKGGRDLSKRGTMVTICAHCGS